MSAVLFPTYRVNAVPLQYDPTFADLGGRVAQPPRLPKTPYLDLQNSFEWRSDMSMNAGVMAQVAHQQQQALRANVRQPVGHNPSAAWTTRARSRLLSCSC